jgi:hypothetical protein
MADIPKEPSPNQLLDSMICLEARLAQMGERIDALANDLQRLAKSNSEGTEHDSAYLWIYHRDIQWLLERITQLEFQVFPQLAKDLCRFYDIASEYDKKGYNALDVGPK